MTLENAIPKMLTSLMKKKRVEFAKSNKLPTLRGLGLRSGGDTKYLLSHKVLPSHQL